jgi:cell filamentation protein
LTHATALANFVDPYLDPDTGLLRNRLGATTQEALDAAEADYGLARTVELDERPVKSTGDLRQLQAIHQRLFQDVYEWAGELRTVDMRKGSDPAAEFFMPVSRLQSGAGFAFRELADDNYLRGLDKDRFVSRLAHHYDQVNYLHPFREGNGRTQRILWTQTAQEAGYELDWRGVTGKVNDQASRDAMEKQDLAGLRSMFDTIVTPVPRGRPTDAQAERVRRFANLDMPLRGSDLAKPPSPSTRNVGRDTTMHRNRETGMGR